MPPMTLADDVQAILRKRAARTGPFADDLPLGGDGLGLDSIAIAEVLLECEQRFGVTATSLLDGEPITVGRLVEHLRRATAA